MSDFVRGNCHKCKYETSAECVPRSQKMGFPKCYQSTVTNADRIRAMTDEELAEYLDGVCHDLWQMFVKDPQKMWLDWLKQEAKDD